MSTHKGFTLVELLVSMALAAIGVTLAMALWFQFFATLLDKQNKGRQQMGRELSLLGLEARIARNCGLLLVAPDRLEWDKCNQDTDRIRIDGNSILLNEQPILDGSVQRLGFTATGPRYNLLSLDSILIPWKQLDTDRNGYIQFEELDVNYSHSLEGRELRYATELVIDVEAQGSPVQQIHLQLR